MNTKGTSHLNPPFNNFFSLSLRFWFTNFWSNQIFHAFILTLRTSMMERKDLETREIEKTVHFVWKCVAVCWTLATVLSTISSSCCSVSVSVLFSFLSFQRQMLHLHCCLDRHFYDFRFFIYFSFFITACSGLKEFRTKMEAENVDGSNYTGFRLTICRVIA